MTSSSLKTNTANAANAMSAEEIAEFLAEPREARLATARRDGSIHLTPVWYVYDEPEMKFCLEQDRLHLKNLRRTPRATLLVDEDLRPTGGWLARARAVMFSGPVQLIDEAASTESVKQRLMARYVDPDDVQRMITRGPPKHYVLIVLRPDRVLTWDFSKQGRPDLAVEGQPI